MGRSRATATAKDGGRCAAVAGDRAAVLAAVLPSGHDPGFERSRRLAQELCDRALAVGGAELDAARLVGLARQVLSTPDGSTWQASLSLLQASAAGARVLNCGTTGVLRAGGRIEPLCSPQTLARRLREEGEPDVPAFASSIGLTFLSENTDPADVDVAAVELREPTLLVAVADPLLFEALLSVDAGVFTSGAALAEEIRRLAAPLQGIDGSHVCLWSEP